MIWERSGNVRTGSYGSCNGKCERKCKVCSRWDNIRLRWRWCSCVFREILPGSLVIKATWQYKRVIASGRIAHKLWRTSCRKPFSNTLWLSGFTFQSSEFSYGYKPDADTWHPVSGGAHELQWHLQHRNQSWNYNIFAFRRSDRMVSLGSLFPIIMCFRFNVKMLKCTKTDIEI